MKTGTRTQVPETLQRRDAEDLAALVAQLLLLVGLAAAVVDDRAGQRQHVERDRPGERARRRGTRPRLPSWVSSVARSATFLICSSSSATPARPAPETAWYVVATSATSPASSCSGRSTGIAAMVVQFGLAMMPLGRLPRGVRVDLGDDERHVRVHPPGRRVVDDHGAGLGDARRELLGAALARREEDDVEPAVVGRRGVLDGHLAVAATAGCGPARAGGGEEPELVNGKLALGQDAAHDATDLSRRAHDADPHAHKSTA